MVNEAIQKLNDPKFCCISSLTGVFLKLCLSNEAVIIIKMDNNSLKKQKVNNGRWTRAEHRKFMDALDKYGRDWVKIEKKLKTRTALQIRSHAQKVFLKMSKQDVDAFIGSDESSSVRPKKAASKIQSYPYQFGQLEIQNPFKENFNTECKEKKSKDLSFQPLVGKIEGKMQNNSQTKQEYVQKQPKMAVVKEISQKPQETLAIQSRNYQSLLYQALKENQRLLLQSSNLQRFIKTLNILSNPFLFPFPRNL